MQVNIATSSNCKQQQCRLAPVRRARSCHYDLRKRVLINNFLKDQRAEPSVPPLESYLTQESANTSTNSDTSTSSIGGNSSDVLITSSFIAVSDDAVVDTSENNPPLASRTTTRKAAATFQRRVIAPTDSPDAAAAQRSCRSKFTRSGTQQPIILQPADLWANHAANQQVMTSPIQDESEARWSRHSFTGMATTLRAPYYITTPCYYGDADRVTRSAVRRPVKRLSSRSINITYEYPPYKTVIPALHTDYTLRNNPPSTSTKSESRNSNARSSFSPKRRVPSFKRRKISNRAVKSPTSISAVSNSFKKQRGRRIQRRSSIKKALVRFIGSQERAASYSREDSEEQRLEKDARKKAAASNTKEKLRKSILDTLFNWTKPSSGLRVKSTTTRSDVRRIRDAEMHETRCSGGDRDVANVVRSHSLHVPRRSKIQVHRDRSSNKELGRKSMSSSDFHTLRALSNGDYGFN